MPVLNVAANPVASISPPAAPESGAATAAEGQANTPFAATLQKQMTDQQKTVPGTTAENKEAKAAAQDASQAALLPLLLGSAELAEWVAANLTPANAAKPAGAETESPSAPTDAVLGLLAVPVSAATNPVVDAAVQARPDENAARDAATAIDRLLNRLLPPAKAEGGTADTEASTANPDSFLAVAEALTKTDKGRTNAPVIAASADSPAIVAVSAETIAAAAKSEVSLRGAIELAPTINRDPNMAATAAAAGLTQVAQNAKATTGTQRIETPVGAAGWHSEVGNHVAWMANHQQGRAELVLTPPQFGRIEISLSVTGDQANAYFVSANPAVRETLESALPRLREILADAGINLGQAQVGSESPGQSADKRENGDNSWRGSAAGSVGDGVASARVGAHAVNPWSTTGRGMVDTFA